VWNEQLDLLKKRLNLWNAAHKQVFRKFVSDVEIISLDGNGRFLIPKRYLKIANIEQSIKFIGMDDTIEIWSNDGDGQPIMDAQEFSRQMEELMGGNGNEQEKELTA
jgi:MraZ protein